MPQPRCLVVRGVTPAADLCQVSSVGAAKAARAVLMPPPRRLVVRGEAPAASVCQVSSAGAVHPIVRRHEETGRNCLYLGRRDHAYVDGVPLDESELLLDEIWSYAALQENCMTHRWRVGDLVIWDNRAVLHRRDGFPAEARRMMRRCQVKSAA